jgi:ribosomal-protein-alanine N-acetyltransferase
MEEFQTNRCILKKVSHDYDQVMFDLSSDPDVMKFIREPDQEIEQSRNSIQKTMDYQERENDFGLWFVFEKETSEPIGFVLLLHIELNPNNPVEVGYRLHKKFWGKGIATELASCMKNYAKELGLKSLCGITIEPNIGSQKVLKKIGMQYKEQRKYYNTDVMYFEVEL